MDGQCRVLLKRHMQYVNILRRYIIVLDGKEIGEIHNGPVVELLMDPGSHSIRMRLDWCSSKPLEFDIESGQTLNLVTGCSINGIKSMLAFLYVTVYRNRYLYVRRA
jgi:hypothetical protein